MRPYIVALMVVLFTLILMFYTVFTYIALKAAVYEACIGMCRQGKTGCFDINGIRCCIEARETGAVLIDENCQPRV